MESQGFLEDLLPRGILGSPEGVPMPRVPQESLRWVTDLSPLGPRTWGKDAGVLRLRLFWEPPLVVEGEGWGEPPRSPEDVSEAGTQQPGALGGQRLPVPYKV